MLWIVSGLHSSGMMPDTPPMFAKSLAVCWPSSPRPTRQITIRICAIHRTRALRNLFLSALDDWRFGHLTFVILSVAPSCKKLSKVVSSPSVMITNVMLARGAHVRICLNRRVRAMMLVPPTGWNSYLRRNGAK